ncbi:MAG: 5-guanidino-2-oxopentanoate decarboxylase [Oceanospirillaceae bacterium]|jgi:acetolactate synthase-1/2/3 large subunit|nr:5-guanidino-2-oxopentanoate decarboxylase [Oceanospirillaceae bacterium]MBT4443807.1 5-guanidino-2-oxopentanoate decarboxylase [Oceanospirillaceae bacterium]
MNTKGQRLIELLQDYGVDTVFGIPGVHTVELYRGLGESNIQHITPRHEQGAGFMADGYARVTGKPGVCFVITGPGLSNIATAMGQALADSIPMLVISTVNPKGTENMGCLHAMPHQQSMIKPLTVACFSIDENAYLDQTMAQVFAALSVSNGTKLGPVHLQIPLDVMGQEALSQDVVPVMDHTAPLATPPSLALKLAANVINNNDSIVILAGGGAVHAQAQVQSLADVLDAPVVTTINGRGLIANHPLSVPASPSLDAVRALLASAQCVIALGTEMGQTDYDMNVNGGFPHLANLIRIDINPALENNKKQLFIHGCVGHTVNALLPLLTTKQSTQISGHSRAASTRQAAMTELPANYQKQCRFLNLITSALPKATMVGDSTQPVYAGNCYFEANCASTWFNSATGFGTLGYAVPAAVGAALGLRFGQEQQAKAANLVAITGDGGLQFCLAELATAKDTGLPIIYLVWNNYGYGEIESSMLAVGVTPVGVSPKPPQLDALAQAYGLHYVKLPDINQLTDILRNYSQGCCPVIIEINEDEIMAQL